MVCGHLLIGPETDQFFSTEHLRWDVAAECTAGGQRPAGDEQAGEDLIVIMDIAGCPAREPHSRKCAGPPFGGHARDSNVVQRAPPRRGGQGGPPAGPVASDRNSGPRDGGGPPVFSRTYKRANISRQRQRDDPGAAKQPARLCGPDRTSTATQAPVPWRPARKGFRFVNHKPGQPAQRPPDTPDCGGLAWRSLINGEDSTGSTRRREAKSRA